MCTEHYSYLEHVVKKINTYRDMCDIWTCINFKMFWRKNMQHNAVLPAPFQTLSVVSEVIPLWHFSGTCSRPSHGQVKDVGRGQCPPGMRFGSSWKCEGEASMLPLPVLQRFLCSRFPLQHLHSVTFADSAKCNLGFWYGVNLHYSLHTQEDAPGFYVALFTALKLDSLVRVLQLFTTCSKILLGSQD